MGYHDRPRDDSSTKAQINWFVIFTDCASFGDSQAHAFFLMSCAHAERKNARTCVREVSFIFVSDLICTYSRPTGTTFDWIRVASMSSREEQ